MNLEQIKNKVEEVLTFDQEGAVPSRGDWVKHRQNLLELLEEDIPLLIDKVEQFQEKIEELENRKEEILVESGKRETKLIKIQQIINE